MTASISRMMNTFYPAYLDFCKGISSLTNRVKQAVDRSFHSLESFFRNCCRCFSPSRHSRSERPHFPTPGGAPPPFRPMAEEQRFPGFDDDWQLPVIRFLIIPGGPGDPLRLVPLSDEPMDQDIGIDDHFENEPPIIRPNQDGRSLLIDSVRSHPQYPEWNNSGNQIFQILNANQSARLNDDLLDSVTCEPFSFPIRLSCCRAILDRSTIDHIEADHPEDASCPCCRGCWIATQTEGNETIRGVVVQFTPATDIQRSILIQLREKGFTS